jgi:hypothetical protein
MEWVKEIGISIVSSGVILGVFVFITKRYFDRLIGSEFEKRLKLAQAEIDQAFHVSGVVVDKQIGIYPEIMEVTHRLRNIMRDALDKAHAYEWGPEFRLLCSHLTENLFKYRLFISEELFDALHEFKHIVQDALILHDVQTREENLFDSEGY